MKIRKSDFKKEEFMGKSKSLGYQIHSALNHINLQDAEKRTEIFNKINDTEFEYVGKREFKKLGQTKEFIFSKRTSEIYKNAGNNRSQI